MEHFLIGIFGVQDHISTAQEAARAVLIFSMVLSCCACLDRACLDIGRRSTS
jgi:hypothetical protein